MFSNRNNHLIKRIFQNGGQIDTGQQPHFGQQLPHEQPQFGQQLPHEQPQFGQQLPHEQPQFGQQQMSGQTEKYPNEDYLYNKITSQDNINNIKIYICAFTINNELETHFVKYIVHKESNVTLPFFIFNSENSQNQNQEPMPQNQNPEPMLQNQNQEPMLQNQNPEPMLQNQNPEPMLQNQNPEPMPQNQMPQNQMPQNQMPQNQMPQNQMPNQQMPNQQMLNPQMPQNQMPNPPMPNPPMPNPPMPNQPMPNPQMPNPQMPGGHLDDSKNEEQIDAMFKTKVIEFVKTMYNNSLEPSYIGYIPNVSEQGTFFVFVKIDNIHNKYFMNLENSEYVECTPNELFHLSKVFNMDVAQPIKDLFTNNKWLYVEQSLSSPFSGYLCKQEGNEIVNVNKGEDPVNFRINIDDIGDYYYFSFLPLDTDPDKMRLYQRYALLPKEYECILETSQLEYYKQNKVSYEYVNSLYFKGEILSNKKDGHQFFAIKDIKQFTDF